ncbi:hypothetical protein AcV7_005218 [Taiwanofungus camphoratus]|nr:hypothetical protein AcV7_005218 [Antrodia cinnamomea]
MFRSGQANPYDEIVAKTTDENFTSENWELILNLCDKVQDEGEQGARNVIASVLKRLTHRNPNVQLYTLTLVEALSKNCGIAVHREIASRAFTQSLEKLVTDRTTHDKVRRRTLYLIATWTADFEKDTTLGMMEECHESLKTKGYKFEAPDEPPPPEVDDEVRRREEEELQRVLEMSVHDKGGRAQWEAYSLASSSGAGGSSSASSSGHVNATPTSKSQQNYSQPPSYGGYVPSASPAVSTDPSSSPSTVTITTTGTSSSASSASAQENIPVVTRVRALHTFEPTEPGELAFEKGDIIKVVDRGYKDWWRGQLKGRTGIFPVNYVEPLPEPTAAEIAKEAEQEAAVFSQAANVDRLLTLLRGMDPAKDNLADNEEIQELYRSCMTLRPKIVKLIDKYSQKRADLVSMNETFVKARTIFDRMMEESLARHTSMYDGRSPYPQSQSQPYIVRPDSRARQEYATPGGPQQYGWNPNVYEQSGYNAYPVSAAPYSARPDGVYSNAMQPQAYVDPNVYTQRPQSAYSHVQGHGAAAGPPVPYGTQSQEYPAPQPSTQNQPQLIPNPQAAASVQPETALQSQQQQPQPQAQQQQSTKQSGPPYVFDPNTTYADPNVQAWAQYYAQGGKDPTGSVYFVSIPGVKEGPVVKASRANSQDTIQVPQTQHQVLQPQPAQTSPKFAQQGVPNQAQGVTSPYGPNATAAHQSSGDLGIIQDAVSNNAMTPIQTQGGPYATGTPQTHSQSSLTSPNLAANTQGPPQQHMPFGASPYGGPAGYASSGPVGHQSSPSGAVVDANGDGQQGTWQAHYNGLPSHFTAMDVTGEVRQSA